VEDETPAAGPSPIAIASVLMAVLGMFVYCCGGFVCLGWIGIFVWIFGAILGAVALVQGGDASTKGFAWAGLILNLLALLMMAGLMMVGLGIGVLGQIADH
jgi:hypothetical protein